MISTRSPGAHVRALAGVASGVIASGSFVSGVEVSSGEGSVDGAVCVVGGAVATVGDVASGVIAVMVVVPVTVPDVGLVVAAVA